MTPPSLSSACIFCACQISVPTGWGMGTEDRQRPIMSQSCQSGLSEAVAQVSLQRGSQAAIHFALPQYRRPLSAAYFSSAKKKTLSKASLALHQSLSSECHWLPFLNPTRARQNSARYEALGSPTLLVLPFGCAISFSPRYHSQACLLHFFLPP